MTLLRSSVWKRRFITGVETTACILTSLRDFAFVLFYKTFWAAPRESSSELDSALGLLQNWDGLEGDAPMEFYKVER